LGHDIGGLQAKQNATLLRFRIVILLDSLLCVMSRFEKLLLQFSAQNSFISIVTVKHENLKTTLGITGPY